MPVPQLPASQLNGGARPARRVLSSSLGYLVAGLSRHGSEELCRRFLPGMINGTERWCQGFSEPGAGSDLASLTTTATRTGSSYVVRGHKIWTSYSDVADWCLLLARTDPDANRHRGLSVFIISMKQPGVQQRPLRSRWSVPPARAGGLP
jgi:alkylation response protein AidB-like acyl-CoA dehydrogenase